MRKKRAKALRKLVDYHPHHPREYFAVPTGAKRIEKKINAKGEEVVEVKDMLQVISSQERKAYQDLKKQFKREEN
jgi:hypothetical protein